MRRSRLVTLAVSLAASIGVTLGAAAPVQAAPSDRYVALGDSYASGVGADSYTSESGACQRSTNAYPALYNTNIKPASYKSVACSGATTTDVVNSQLSALTSTTTLVSVTGRRQRRRLRSIMSTCVLQGETECVAAVQAAENKAQRGTARQAGDRLQRDPVPRAVGPGGGRRLPGLLPARHGLRGAQRELPREDQRGHQPGGRHHPYRRRPAGFTFADVRSNFVGHQLCSYGESGCTR